MNVANTTTKPNLAHFTLYGEPLCACMYPANADRLKAAGDPPCSDHVTKQLRRFNNLAKQFPGRVALVHGGCPQSALDKAVTA